MKILIYTPSFYPKVGGLETVNYLIAQGLSKHFELTVVTPVLEDDNDHCYSFRIIRTKSVFVLLKEYMKCNLFVHSVLSLKGILPLVIWPKKKWVAIHHTCYFRVWDKDETLSSKLKKFMSRFSHNICVSDAVAKSLELKDYTVIHNSYNNSLFHNNGQEKRDGFVFVGRLVTEKGIDILIEAYQIYLKSSLKKQKLYIVGDGPMMETCKRLAAKSIQNGDIIFKGLLGG